MDGECLKCPSISSPDGLLVSGPGGAPREDGAVSSSPAGPFAKEAPQTGGLTIRGSVGPSGNPGVLPGVPQVGWAYAAADPGVYGGLAATEGDLIYCVSASPVRWAILQSDSDDAGRDLVRASLSFSASPLPSLSLETETAAGVSSVQTVDVSALAVDESVVHKTGDEAITGVKVFSNAHQTDLDTDPELRASSILIKSPDLVRGVIPEHRRYVNLQLVDSTGTDIGHTGRLGSMEYQSPFSNAGIYGVYIRCWKFLPSDAPNPSTGTSLFVGYDENEISFATAPSTSNLRTNGTDIVTRDWRITEAEIDVLSA